MQRKIRRSDSDAPATAMLPPEIERLDLNNLDDIIRWIDRNAIRMKG